MSHHPSCTPGDKSLVYLCHQCGTQEPATHLEDLRSELTLVRTEVNQLRRDIDAELDGNAILRSKYGALPNETMDMWLARLYSGYDAKLTEKRAEKQALDKSMLEREALQIKIPEGGS